MELITLQLSATPLTGFREQRSNHQHHTISQAFPWLHCLPRGVAHPDQSDEQWSSRLSEMEANVSSDLLLLSVRISQ